MELSFSDILGKVILVGFTYYTPDGEFVEQKQYYGTVVKCDETQILIRKKNGELFNIPPDLRSTKPASPGEYRLRSTGEVVVNPDFLSTWNVEMPESK